MSRAHRITAFALTLFHVTSLSALCHAQSPPGGGLPVSISVYDRTRIDTWLWFAAPPQSNTYSYVESLLRVGVAQHLHQWDWQLEFAQPSVLGLPDDAISPVTAQGQLGLGATYYASNANNTNAAAAFLKQGFLRYHFDGADKNLRLGRFEYIDGQETQPKNAVIAWLQANRVAHRLIGNFGFSDAQRSFDGVDGHYGNGTWDIAAMAGRADQGVFNMNGNPELNVDVQYLAFTKSDWNHRALWRAFAIGYHDGRTGITKTDNRAQAVRAADHQNIRIGSYGGDLLASIPAGAGQFDFLLWGVLQNGSWGALEHKANAAAVEGGYQFRVQSRAPWIRAGWFRGSGDSNATDNKHGTFFQLLPTPRIYARIPFYNLMNDTDEFVQVVEKPADKLEFRCDLHWLQLTSDKDLWYQGGGAYDNKVFGYVGRPANGQTSFASLVDISADWQVTKRIALNFYYAHVWGKSVIERIYPVDQNAQYGYVELVYHFDVQQRTVKK
jgi:Alginate export